MAPGQTERSQTRRELGLHPGLKSSIVYESSLVPCYISGLSSSPLHTQQLLLLWISAQACQSPDNDENPFYKF